MATRDNDYDPYKDDELGLLEDDAGSSTNLLTGPAQSAQPDPLPTAGSGGGGTLPTAPAPTQDTSLTQPVDYGQAMAGWDQTKWANPEHQTPKYQVGRILSQFNPNPEGLGMALPQIQAAFPGAQLVGRDKLMIPGVGIIDVGANFASGQNMSWAWQDTADPGYGQSAQSPAQSAMLSALSGMRSGQMGSTSQGLGSAMKNPLQQALLALMQRQITPSENDPEIAKALQANRLAEQRGFERNRAMLAERAAAQGFSDSGGFETDLMGLAQDRSGREAEFEGNLYQAAAQRRVQEILSALSLGAGIISDEERLALQRELGMLSAELDRARLGESARQFDIGTGVDVGKFEALMNERAWDAMR